MRHPALAIALSCMLIATPASSQETRAATDPPGDVKLQAEGEEHPAQGDWNHVDLIEVWVGNETIDTVEVGLAVVQWSPSTPQSVGAARFISFEVDGQAYQVRFDAGDCRGSAMLGTFNAATNSFEFLECIQTNLDPQEAMISAIVPKALLKDGRGLPARIGTSMEAIQAHARQSITYSILIPDRGVQSSAFDVAPDIATLTYPFQVGSDPDATMVLTSPAPIRFSNGAASSLAFEINIDNLGEADEALLSVQGVPDHWTTKFPPRIQLTGYESVVVPVIVSIPFAHQHGDTKTFKLEATRTSSGETQSLELGVLFPEIPQPAGHHDRVYLHGAEPNSGVAGWANTAREDPAASQTRVASDSVVNTFDAIPTLRWHFPFKPPMLTGMDFDLEREGTWNFQMEAGFADPEAELWTRVLYCRPGEVEGQQAGRFGCDRGSWIELASHHRMLAVDTQELLVFEIPLVFSEVADVIHYQPSSNLMFQVDYRTNTGQSYGLATIEPLILVQENDILLPLIDYIEPLDQAFAHIGELRLESLDGLQVNVNPGKTTVFDFTIHNMGGEKKRLSLIAEGPHRQWASWSTDRITLPDGESRDASFAISIPDEIPDGTTVDLFAIVENEEEPLDLAMVRVRAMVTTAEEIPTETLVREGNSKSVPMVAAGLLALLLIGAARQNRHQK